MEQGPVGRLFLRPPSLTASNFKAFYFTDPLFTMSKDLILLKKRTKNQTVCKQADTFLVKYICLCIITCKNVAYFSCFTFQGHSDLKSLRIKKDIFKNWPLVKKQQILSNPNETW